MKESITIYSCPVHNTEFLPEAIQPQHTFLIYTNSQGQNFIYRGGPSGDNMVTGNLEITLSSYEKGSVDWVNPQTLSTYPSKTLKQGDDLSSLWNKLNSRAENINKINLDYEPLNKNCNAVTNDAVTVMGDSDMIGAYNKYIKQQDFKTPGAGTDNAILTHSTSDIALQSISNDLYSIHEKLFSTENLSIASQQDERPAG